MFLSIVNVGLRGLTMAGRFVLLVALGAYLAPEDVGLYALFAAASTWGVYLQGMEFHLFNVRELVAADRTAWPRRVRDAFALYGVVFVGACVVWLGMFGAGFLPMRLLGWFLAILALEHAVQELYRLLNAFGRPLAGSIVLLARSGSWMYVVAALMWRVPSLRSLDAVWAGWVVGGAVALALSIVFLRDLAWKNLSRIDWTWLRRGLAVGLPLLAGSLAWRGITVFERWFLGYSQGDATLGVFGFFSAIAAALPVLAESGVGAVLYPRMMKAWQTGDLPAYRAYVRRLWLTFAAFVVIAAPLALGAVLVAVPHLHSSAYEDELRVYYVLLVAAVIASVAAVPQYVLWTRHRDRTMIAISIIGLVTAVAADLVLVPRHGALGAAFGQLGTVVLVFALRLYAVRTADR